MKHLQIDKLFNDKLSLKIGYYENNRFKLITDTSNEKEKLHIMLRLWDEKSKIVYRGFSSESVNSNFWSYIFTVGDKGSHFRNDVFYPSTEMDTRYFSDHKKTGKENYYYLLSKLQDTILPDINNKRMIPEVESLVARFDEYRKSNKFEYEQMYYLLLAWLHNIGNKTGLKYDSPLISTTTSLNTAFSFRNKKSQKHYAFVILLTESKISDYFDTNNLNKMLKKLNINWYKNIHKEIMFKDSIFPHTIIAVIEKDGKDSRLIINPNLLNYLRADYDTKFIADLLQKLGMKIDDKDFEIGAEILGYKKTVEQYSSERKIVSKDGKNYTVEEMKSLNFLTNIKNE